MTQPAFGIQINKDDSEPRPVSGVDMSVVGLIGTAPAANAATFPINHPVLISSADPAALTALGATGTLIDTLNLLNAQLDDYQIAAKVVIVRVTEGEADSETMANIVGNAAAQTGLYALLTAGPICGAIPRLIAVPGYTHQQAEGGLANPVCAALGGILPKLIGHAVVEGPGTTAQAIKDWRETLNDLRLIPVDAWVKVSVADEIVTKPGVGAVLGIAVRRDFEKLGIPGHSWANQPVKGIVGPARNVAFSLTDGATEGQDLLASDVGIVLRGELGVETAVANSGFVFVGFANAGDDSLWPFYNQMRMRDYIHLSFLKELRYYLGRFNITRQTIQAILNTMSLFLRNLRADEHILGYKVGFEADKNSPENLRAGKFRCFFRAEEPAVLRLLTIDSRRYRQALVDLMNELSVSLGDLNG